jgi:alkaline phosphatase
MNNFFKYLLVAIISSIATFLIINQYAPLLIEVPEKDQKILPIDFKKDLNPKELKQVDLKARNIILLIGDGMGPTHISVYRNVRGGPNHKLSLDKFDFSGYVKTHAYNSLVTDSAASATAFSSGVKTINRYVGVDHNKKPAKNITEMLFEKGFVNTIISTSEITHATPAAFASHVSSRYEKEKIAEHIYNSKNHIVLGGGTNYFLPIEEGGIRKDGVDYVKKIKKNFHYLETKKDLDNFNYSDRKKIFGLFAEDDLERTEFEPNLLEMLDFSIRESKRLLADGCKGFFIMAEGSKIDWASHDNDYEYYLKEMQEFEKTVKKALNFAEENNDTLVIVAADHETGGLLIEQDDARYRETGNMKISWNTAVGRGVHTGIMIPVFAQGPGAENFSGVMDNTDVFFAMKEALGIDNLEDYQCN